MSLEDQDGQEVCFLEKRIQRDIARLRYLLHSAETKVRYGLEQEVYIEIGGEVYDDSLSVRGAGMGFTSVRYSPEGLTVYVHDERMREVAQISLPAEILNFKEQQ